MHPKTERMSSVGSSTLQIAAQQNCSMHPRARIGTIECLASAHCNGGMACERAPQNDIECQHILAQDCCYTWLSCGTIKNTTPSATSRQGITELDSPVIFQVLFWAHQNASLKMGFFMFLEETKELLEEEKEKERRKRTSSPWHSRSPCHPPNSYVNKQLWPLQPQYIMIAFHVPSDTKTLFKGSLPMHHWR